MTVRLPAHVKPERYEIFLKPDLIGFSFEGEETISLVLSKPTKEITLHSAEIDIKSAEWIKGSQESIGGRVEYNKKAETATFIFPKSLKTGKGELKIKFSGILNDKMRGFYRSKYGEKHMATTQFESTDARRAFPSFDEPNQKAIFDVTLMIPGNTVAISNTVESVVKEDEAGWKVVKFAPTPKMSTYLLAFIVGEFEYIEAPLRQGSAGQGNTMVRVFTTPGKKDQAKFALDVAVKCMKYYEDYFDIKYPLPVLDMIAIPDFAAGAMENWGAVTYRESTLLIDEEKSSSANKQWVAMVIAHELAHQWFGNLVTMEWWTHLWLNEGFASFIEYLAIDEIFPEYDIWTQFISTELADAFSLDALKNTHPIEVEVGDPAEISEIFDRISYSKGASVLRMLWKYLGEKDFRDGLRHYLKRHQYGNASTEDLWKALEEVSGKPVGKIMANWTSKSGHPLIRVQRTGNRQQLIQERFFISPISKRESKDNTIWSIPINGKLMDKKSMEWTGNGKLNLGEVSLVRVDYPHQYLKSLESQVKSGKLGAPDRLGLIRDSFDLAQSGNSPTTLALELAKSYINETDYIVWSELTGQLSQLDNLLALEDFYPKFQAYGREVYSKIAAKMGWDKRSGEKHTDSLLRAMALYQLGKYGELGIIREAQERFKKGSPRSAGGAGRIEPDLRGVVYNLVAGNGGQKEWNSLVKMYKEEDNQQEKDRLGRSLGLFKSKTLLKRSLEFAISKDVRFQNTLGIIVSVWGNSEGRYLAWEFIKKNWKMLKERYAGGHYFTRVFSPAGEFTKVSDAKDIEEFVKKNPTPEAERTIAQTLERIYANSEWLKRDKEGIKRFLGKV